MDCGNGNPSGKRKNPRYEYDEGEGEGEYSKRDSTSLTEMEALLSRQYESPSITNEAGRCETRLNAVKESEVAPLPSVLNEELPLFRSNIPQSANTTANNVRTEDTEEGTYSSAMLRTSPVIDIKVLRNMSSDDVHNVLQPFFRKNQMSMDRFEQITAQLRQRMVSDTNLEIRQKRVLDRWRLLVNVSNWGKGEEKKNDVLFPSELVPPASTLMEMDSNTSRRCDGTVPAQPKGKTYLRAHQLRGIRFMWSILVEGPVGQVPAVGCILAHTMGLGKTCQVIVFVHLFLDVLPKSLGHWYSPNWRQVHVLIVVPKSTRQAWLEEFHKWSQFFPPAKRIVPAFLSDCSKMNQRVDIFNEWKNNGGVLLMGYEMLYSVAKAIHEDGKEVWNSSKYIDLLVCDEAHRLKSENLFMANFLKIFNPLRRLLITGTPLQNHLKEYWVMVDFAVRNYFNKHRFQRYFVEPIEAAADQRASSHEVAAAKEKTSALIQELKNFVQCVNGTVLQNDLPPLHEYVVILPLSPTQAKLYNEFLDVARVDSSETKVFMQVVMCLNKICAHPQLLYATTFGISSQGHQRAIATELKEDNYDLDEGCDDVETEDENTDAETATLRTKGRGLCQPPPGYVPTPQEGIKLFVAALIIKAAMLRHEKCLFFSMSTKLLDIFETVISNVSVQWLDDGTITRPIRYCRLDGKKTEKKRSEVLKSFASSAGADVFLISTKAGGLGLTITSASRVIIADWSFNPADDRQAIGRAYRYGQTKPVYAYRLICYETVEYRMFKQKLAKEWLFRTVVEQASLKRDALSGFHLQTMFELLNPERPVTSGKQQLTAEQYRSTASIIADDEVLADVSEHILYAELHSMFLQQEEVENVTGEGQHLRREYGENCKFDDGSSLNHLDNGVMRDSRTQELLYSHIQQNSRPTQTLLDEQFKLRDESNLHVTELEQKVSTAPCGSENVTSDANGVRRNPPGAERPREVLESRRRNGGGFSGRLPECKIPRLEVGPCVGDKRLCSTAGQPTNACLWNNDTQLRQFTPLVDPKVYSNMAPGGSSDQPIYIDDDSS